jgi:hypothetical protein
MSDNCLPFDGFRSSCQEAAFYYPRPYGIYHKGEVYWDSKLPRRPGSVVRYFEDPSGPCVSLVVLTIDGDYLCTAYPPAWHEGDHPALLEAEAWWGSLTPAERAEILADQ